MTNQLASNLLQIYRIQKETNTDSSVPQIINVPAVVDGQNLTAMRQRKDFERIFLPDM